MSSNKVFVLEDEAVSAPFVFSYQGEEYEVAHIDDLDVFKLQYASRVLGGSGLMIEVMLLGLGDRRGDLEKVGMKRKTFEKLAKQYEEHVGLSEGESSASSD